MGMWNPPSLNPGGKSTAKPGWNPTDKSGNWNWSKSSSQKDSVRSRRGGGSSSDPNLKNRINRGRREGPVLKPDSGTPSRGHQSGAFDTWAKHGRGLGREYQSGTTNMFGSGYSPGAWDRAMDAARNQARGGQLGYDYKGAGYADMLARSQWERAMRDRLSWQPWKNPKWPLSRPYGPAPALKPLGSAKSSARLSEGLGLGLGTNLGKGLGLLGSVAMIFDIAQWISDFAGHVDDKLEEFMGLDSPPYTDTGQFMPEPGETSQSSEETNTSPSVPPVIWNPTWLSVTYTISQRWEIYTYSNLRDNTRYFAFWGDYPVLADIIGYRGTFNLQYRIFTEPQYVFLHWEVGERLFIPAGEPGAGRYIGASRIASIGFIALGWVNLDTGEYEIYDEPTLVRIAWNKNFSSHGWGGVWGEPIMEVPEQTGAIWGTYDLPRIHPQFFPGMSGRTEKTSENDMTCPDIRPLLLQHQAQIKQQISALSQANTTNISNTINQSQATIVNTINQSQSATVADLADLKNRMGPQIPGGISGGVSSALDRLGPQTPGGISATTGKISQDVQSITEKTTEIIERLGPKIEGGISGVLEALKTGVKSATDALSKLAERFDKFLKWIQFDRILNVLILVSTIHNGYLLSRNLGETLVSMFNNILTAAGNALGLRDVDDQPIDIGPIVGSTIENIIKGLVGAETLDGIKTGWKKYSAILNAAATLMYTVQSLNQSIISALEIVGSNVAKIGNALKRWGEVSERAFTWMNVAPNFNNPFFSLVERAEDRASQIDMVAMETISAQEQVKQVGEMTEVLQKSIAELDGGKAGKESPEAARVKAKEDASKTASQSSAQIPYRSE